MLAELRVLHPDGTISYPYLSARTLDIFGCTAEEAMADPRVVLEPLTAGRVGSDVVVGFDIGKFEILAVPRWGNADFGLKTYDPLAWAKRHGVAADKAAEALLELLLQGDVGARARDAVLGAGRAGTADGLRKALQLIVHCPEFQLA